MVDEYVYRVDENFGLQSIPDGCHRAPRWPKGSNPFPHKLLKDRLSSLPSTHGIYRICFFVTLAKAEATRLSYKNKGATTTLARCRKADVLAAGFTDSWDDGFHEGVAHLYWIEEQASSLNDCLSEACIPFDRFEALVNGNWVPLPTHLAPVKPQIQPSAEMSPPPKRGLGLRLASTIRSLWSK